jgi:membrane protease YdiL (CAAX protease family)
MDPKTRNSLLVYLILTFGVSSIFYVRSLGGAALETLALPLMWTPGLAAIVTRLTFDRTLAGMGWRLGPWRYLGLAAVVPIAYCLVIYVPVWMTGLGSYKPGYLSMVAPLLPLALVQGLVLALGEEIGWRGFLVPTVAGALGFGWAGIGVGIVWALWHVPLIFADYSAGTPLWWAIPWFIISVSSMSVMLAWLRLRSGSFWPAVVFHAVHNVTIQGIFDGATIDTGPTRWITTEFGIGLTIVTALIGVYFWRRRHELSVGWDAPPSESVAPA